MPTVVYILGGIVISGVAYYLYKQNNTDNKSNSEKPVKKLIEDEDKYNGYKTIIENAIKEKNWENLEALLNSGVKRFPDLIKMIEEALKGRK